MNEINTMTVFFSEQNNIYSTIFQPSPKNKSGWLPTWSHVQKKFKNANKNVKRNPPVSLKF